MRWDVYAKSFAIFFERHVNYRHIVFAENKKGCEHRQPSCETQKAHAQRTVRVVVAAAK